MSSNYLGEIRVVPFNFAPRSWADCSGQLMSIAQNTALFTLLGTTYGGDGVTTFALPNLKGRLPVHLGQGSGLTNRILGEAGGAETVTLTTNQISSHTHPLSAANAKPVMGVRTEAPTTTGPNGGFIAGADIYIPKNAAVSPDAGLNATTISFGQGAATDAAGGSQPHTNVQPFLVLRFIIALQGVFPSQN